MLFACLHVERLRHEPNAKGAKSNSVRVNTFYKFLGFGHQQRHSLVVTPYILTTEVTTENIGLGLAQRIAMIMLQLWQNELTKTHIPLAELLA